jgi:hypothetical protein
VNDAGEFQNAKCDQNNHQYESNPPEAFAAWVAGGFSHFIALPEFFSRRPDGPRRYSRSQMKHI